LHPSEKICTKINTCYLKWVNKNDDDNNKEIIKLPVYLNNTRKTLITSLEITGDKNYKNEFWYEIGAAFTAWNKFWHLNICVV